MRELLRAALDRALFATDPYRLVGEALGPPPPRAHVLAVGKAAWPMLKAVEEVWPDAIGFGVTRYGHAGKLSRMRLVEAGHPVPDRNSEAAADEALALAQSLGSGDFLLLLVSGGGSALWAAPWGVTLEEKQGLTRELLKSGASIHEINAVRKHLSRIKGGRLAEAAYPARVRALLLSDVPGDDPSTIASGPAVPDPTTFEDALGVLDRYGVTSKKARAHLEAGARGELPETPKPGAPVFSGVETEILASNADLLQSAADYLEDKGFPTLILSDRLTGEARDLARVHAEIILSARKRGLPRRPPFALLSGGEAGVTVRGEGRGGRNQEFLLWLLFYLGPEGVWALAVDSDGIDGNTDVAGALLTPDSFHRALALGLDPAAYLARNDAHGFFSALGDLVQTGPTANNLNDLRIILV